MTPDLLLYLCCPDCRSGLDLRIVSEKDGRVATGSLMCKGCTKAFPIVNHIPRFVSSENYAKGFGMQWNLFRNTQLDSHSGRPISRERFVTTTGWTEIDMRGKLILDVGCGAGRFTEIALSFGARVIAVDFSSSVEACWTNHGTSSRLDVIQADIFRLPFNRGSFDLLYCMGVLQHTPDVEKAFDRLPEQLKPGGKLAVDVYAKLVLNLVWPKYWLRPVTKRIRPDLLFGLCTKMVNTFFPISLALGKVPRIGRKLRYVLPIANYEGILPLSAEQLREWAVLDTFDMLSPAHDHPQKATTLESWFRKHDFRNIEVFRSGFLVGRGVKP